MVRVLISQMAISDHGIWGYTEAMKSLGLVLLLGTVPALSQSFGLFEFGIKGGVPLTDFVNASLAYGGFGNYVETTNRYIVGPTAEFRLPFGLSVEFDALYRHLNYEFGNPACLGGTVLYTCVLRSSTAGSAWEFPLLAKYRFYGKSLRPYVDAGVAWNTMSGFHQTTEYVPASGQPNVPQTTTGILSPPAELLNETVVGFATGVGVDIHALLLHFSPEIRYTRWGAKNFSSQDGGLFSNQNQVECLLGITF
jgi:opacity protein-like surface antigen